ncbi:MAG: hypothetical protein GXP45_00605 [bacterium]|nr:hypothetical protein [bacterium]
MPPIEGFQQNPMNNFASVPSADFGAVLNNSKLNSEPNNLNGWQLLGKMAIGLVVGVLIAVLLFVVLSFVGTMFSEAIQ